MKREDLLHLLALQRTKGFGDIVAKKLIVHCGGAKAVLAEKKSSLQKINGIGTHTIRHLHDSIYLKQATEEIIWAAKNNVRLISFFDEDYPEQLKQCIDSPLVLFSVGNQHLKDRKCISIVGTRNMTSYGREMCEALIEKIAPYNPIIISGFAFGVDICAHKAALEHELQTIGVLAHGFDQIYPNIHKQFMAPMEKNGGFLSEFWKGDPPLREHFLKRNRIIAGLSQATIVIESAFKGGSLVTADIANSYNRDVFAFPGRTSDLFSKGCNTLIKNHKAAIITSADDLIRTLNWDTKSQKAVIQKQLFINLNPEEQQVYDFLLKQGKSILDTIALQNNFTIQKTVSILFNLELQSVVRPLPGKQYEAI
ncbi:MAG: DNA-protecting protein DprA [Flavobacteriaceae bacterium]|nr:DNA-protecting protein DprA [Flavobacteriaceae bacterium]